MCLPLPHGGGGFGGLAFPLSPQASADRPFLVFGSTIGVVVGSISVRDARPACIPEGSSRGPVLPMEGGGGGDGKIASERVRFKVRQGFFMRVHGSSRNGVRR